MAHQGGDVDGLGGHLRRPDLAEVQQRLDGRAQPVGLLEDRLDLLAVHPVGGQALDTQPQRREGVAELVRGVGDELALLRLRCLDAVGPCR